MKSMFVFDVEKNGSLGYGSLPFERTLQVSHEYNALSIDGTVSEEVPQTMAFLEKERTCCQREAPIQYKKSFNEYLFQYYRNNSK